MREELNKFLKNYPDVTSQPFAGNSFRTFVRNDIPKAIYETGLTPKSTYHVTASVGQGNWAMVPWIGIFDRSITISATKGLYIVYLLSRDGQRLYLTFNQGCTEIRKTHSKRDTFSIMRRQAQDIASQIDSRGFATDEDINLGEHLTELGEMYQRGTIFYKQYMKDQLPSETDLQKDLSAMMEIYREYVSKIDQNRRAQSSEGDRDRMSVKESIERIKEYIAGQGFSYPDGLIENFYLSLKSKPFVILAGTSGTGKTRLVKLFAEALGSTSTEGGGNGRYKLVPVRPDWSDSSDLFGHVNLKGEFVPGAIIDFIKNAASDLNHPYFLCLDEMNLARVEYYLSDFLSIIETRRQVNNEIVTDEILLDQSATPKYGKVSLPENLYLIGTVNMDETTFPFSRKVLDRANTIEFSYVDLRPDFVQVEDNVDPLLLENCFLKTEYLTLAVDVPEMEREFVREVCEELQAINGILQKAQAHIGYRVRDEIVYYMLNNKNDQLLERNVAMDNEIMQKILPRIQGSSNSIKEMLCELFQKCAGDYTGLAQPAIHEQMQAYLDTRDCKYKKSAEKICYMVRRFEEDGFTSYWL